MPIILRPHHLLDILRDFGHGIRYEPHEYGHALHSVAEQILKDLDRKIVFVVAADDICKPCRHLRADGRCDDTMLQDGKTVSKQAYNDALDRRLWDYLNLADVGTTTLRSFLARFSGRLTGIEDICSHPGEDRKYRKMGLIKALEKMPPSRS
jgi:hypothetical protein